MSTLWPIEPHTIQKHSILRRYMEAWIPIMSKITRRIVYIDGFAGPGEYTKGEEGSPLIVLDVAESHKTPWKGELVCTFIELDKKRCENLSRKISGKKIQRNIKYEIINGDCNSEICSTLDNLDEKGLSLAPTFAFLDPCGIKDIPFSLIENIFRREKSEVLITFVLNGIIRNITIKENHKLIDNLYGTDAWKRSIKMKGKQKQEFLLELYQNRIKQINKGDVFIRSFKMVNNQNNTSYYLVYATKHVRGLEKMKDSMWKVDERGTFQFSDVTDPGQSVLYSLGDTKYLEKQLIEEFKEKDFTIGDAIDFTIRRTAFLEKHVRPILRKFEKADSPKLEVTESKRQKRYTYPEGTRMKLI